MYSRDFVKNSESIKFNEFFWRFSEFSKNRIENFIDSNYTPKIAKSGLATVTDVCLQ